MPDHPAALPILVTLSGGNASGPDGRFNEVSELTLSLDVLTLKEGGDNPFDHQLPGRVQVRPVTLRHGLLPAQGRIVRWCSDVLQSGLESPISPRDLTITLLDEGHERVEAWSLTNAYPTRWSASGLDSKGDQLVIETLEFAFTVIRRIS